MDKQPRPKPTPASRPEPRLADFGGQYRAPIGSSTKDKSDYEDQQERLADFEAALEQARYGCVSGREW